MKKTLACIFAHPDDEAFGPAGTIAKLASEHEVFLLCATRGEAGQNNLTKKTAQQLNQIRESELRKSAKILGIKKVFFLDFIDGELCNNTYHKLAEKIMEVLDAIKPDTILTNEHRGNSGHIDHITISMVSSFVFEKLPYVKTIMYHCTSDKMKALNIGYFIYVPPGYKKSEVDLVVNIQPYWDIKVKAMHCHKSQMEDAKRILKRWENLPKEEYFLVRNK